MKRNTNILQLLLLGTVIIVFLSIFIFFDLSNRIDYNELTEVSISNANGLACVYDKYTLTHKDEGWVATKSSFGVDDACEIVVDDAFITKIKDILVENNVHRWDGFDKKLTYIHDASSVEFSMRFSDGKEIKASGYATYPKNFYTVFNEFKNLFEELFSE